MKKVVVVLIVFVGLVLLGLFFSLGITGFVVNESNNTITGESIRDVLRFFGFGDVQISPGEGVFMGKR